MNRQSDLQQGFYLGAWYIEPNLGKLTKYNKTAQLEPKIMDVLVCLAENQGRVVKRQAFFGDVWEGINVTEHVLARAISEIRKVLGDDPQKPVFIQTIPKIGYRLVAPVSTEIFEETVSDAQAPNSVFAFPQISIQINSANLLFFAGGFLTVIIFLALVTIFMSGNHGHLHTN